MAALLLDTHALLWWLAGDPGLSQPARTAIGNEENAIYISAATAWEIATKFRIGKLPDVTSLIDDLDAIIASQGFKALPISLRHGQVAGSLPGPHKDPFDRMLMAQAMLEGMVLISNESAFDRYGVRRLW
ncbi:MAG TPA: type II toxin-antitoxin system VapC family toxin [Rhodospirillaceae bacterium]|nr:type II toxin-antitoxin system VapC family toxin [Rhodospirillaceae bacterium]